MCFSFFPLFFFCLCFISVQTNICCQIGDGVSFICSCFGYLHAVALSCCALSSSDHRSISGKLGMNSNLMLCTKTIGLKSEHTAQKNMYLCTVIMIKGHVSCFKDRISLVYLFASVAAPASNLWRVAVFLD